MYFPKNARAERGNQSSVAVADQATRNPAPTRGDLAHFRFWKEQGISVRAATVLAAVGCKTRDEVRDLGWHFFQQQGNCGGRTLQELSDLAGGWPDVPCKYRAWIRHTPDDVLLEEMRRRGIAVGSDAA